MPSSTSTRRHSTRVEREWADFPFQPIDDVFRMADVATLPPVDRKVLQFGFRQAHQRQQFVVPAGRLQPHQALRVLDMAPVHAHVVQEQGGDRVGSAVLHRFPEMAFAEPGIVVPIHAPVGVPRGVWPGRRRRWRHDRRFPS